MNMFHLLRFVRRPSCGNRLSRLRTNLRRRKLQHELLDRRDLLAADLVPLEFNSNGTDLIVEYSVRNDAAVPFSIGIYTTFDGIHPDTLLQTHRVNDAVGLSTGLHAQAIDATFADSAGDYGLLAVLDVHGEISEVRESNNHRLFGGGVFRSGSTIHVHGSVGADRVLIGDDGSQVTLNGRTYSFDPSEVGDVHVRAHAGNDTVTSLSSRSLWAFGGAGNDRLSGAAGADRLVGGLGNDTLSGGDATDWLDGSDGDDVMIGGDGDDELFGGGGFDRLDGGLGINVISGGDDVDLIESGSGIDIYRGGDDDLFIDVPSEVDALDTYDAEANGYGGYGPSISDLWVSFVNGTLTIAGSIIDDDVDSAVVSVGGSFTGQHDAEADPDGEFDVLFQNLDNFTGWISITVTDNDGNTSAPQWWLVRN